MSIEQELEIERLRDEVKFLKRALAKTQDELYAAQRGRQKPMTGVERVQKYRAKLKAKQQGIQDFKG